MNQSDFEAMFFIAAIISVALLVIFLIVAISILGYIKRGRSKHGAIKEFHRARIAEKQEKLTDAIDHYIAAQHYLQVAGSDISKAHKEWYKTQIDEGMKRLHYTPKK